MWVSLVHVLAFRLLQECRDNPLGNFQEGHVKTFLAGVILQQGHALFESSVQGGSGLRISLEDGVLVTSTLPMASFQADKPAGYGKSADLRILPPAHCAIELKVRTTAGCAKGISSGTLLKDIDRLKSGMVDALIIAADRKLYQALRGEKEDRRGRAATCPAIFKRLFPPYEAIAQDMLAVEPSTYVDGCFADAGRTTGKHGVDRVVVAVTRISQN